MCSLEVFNDFRMLITATPITFYRHCINCTKFSIYQLETVIIYCYNIIEILSLVVI